MRLRSQASIVDTMWLEGALVAGAYLLGSVPQLSLLARASHLELTGDFHDSLWRANRAVGALGIAGDLAKGVVPVLLGRLVFLEPTVAALGGLAAVMGQMWPVFRRFDGEKGNSVGLAVAVTLMPGPALIALTPVLLALIIRTVPRLSRKARKQGELIISGPPSRSLPVGMALGFAALPASAWAFGQPAGVVVTSLALFVAIMVRRVTAGLRADLREATNAGDVLVKRLVYDRSSREWRSQKTPTV